MSGEVKVRDAPASPDHAEVEPTLRFGLAEGVPGRLPAQLFQPFRARPAVDRALGRLRSLAEG